MEKFEAKKQKPSIINSLKTIDKDIDKDLDRKKRVQEIKEFVDGLPETDFGPQKEDFAGFFTHYLEGEKFKLLHRELKNKSIVDLGSGVFETKMAEFITEFGIEWKEWHILDKLSQLEVKEYIAVERFDHYINRKGLRQELKEDAKKIWNRRR